MPERERKFLKWFNDPTRQRVLEQDYDTSLGDAHKLIKDYLRSAFEGGYQACLADVDSKLSELSAGGNQASISLPSSTS